MYAIIRRYRVAPESADEVIRRVDEVWLDQVARMPGFVSYYVVRGGDAELTSMTVVIDGEAGQRALEASAEWVGGNLMDLDVNLIDMRQGQVVVHGGE
jgi:heme-degrading monooxygenase HmoA